MSTRSRARHRIRPSLGLFAASFLPLLGTLPSPASAQQPALTVLHTFDVAGASEPTKGLLLGRDGNFYGVTPDIGSTSSGSVFKLTPAGVLTTLATFTGPNGSDPEGMLVQGNDGFLYGTTQSGGPLSDDAGTVFKLNTDGSGFQTLHAFSRIDDPNSPIVGDYPTGRLPEAGLTVGPDGNLYGTTSDQGARTPGGQSGDGTVFRISSAGAFQTVYTFHGEYQKEGDTPRAPLALDADGSFYSTTSAGGPAGEIGTIFRVTTAGVKTELHDFVHTDGSDPEGGLVLAPDGKYYGLTEANGSANLGTYYRISRDGTFELLGSFTGPNGAQPFDEMIVASDGNLYGTTSGGGDGGIGTIFRLTTAGVLTTIYSFPNNGTPGYGITGYFPRGTLVQGMDGRLYGTTSRSGTVNGAANNGGTVFALSLDDNHPAFFIGETPLSNGVYYLALRDGTPFGYYSYLSDPNYIYHFDLGYEYLFDADDGKGGVYFYDFKSNGFFYTSPSFPFPYLYDFSLNSVVYYYPDPNNAGHYNTNGIRYFYVFSTGQIITK